MAEETIHTNEHQENTNATAGTTGTARQERPAEHDRRQVRVVSAIGYISILFLVPYIMYPKNAFAVFHANQGLLLFIVGIIINIVGRFIPFVGWSVIIPLGNLFVLILLVIGIINAMNDKKKRLPLIGEFDILKVQK